MMLAAASRPAAVLPPGMKSWILATSGMLVSSPPRRQDSCALVLRHRPELIPRGPPGEFIHFIDR